jgi:hypothetical protein
MDLDRLIRVKGNALQLLESLDISQTEFVDAYRQAARDVVASGETELHLDFSQARVLSSSIIALVFLVTGDLEGTGVTIHVVASMRDHRPLVSSGLTQYVELHLCG